MFIVQINWYMTVDWNILNSLRLGVKYITNFTLSFPALYLLIVSSLMQSAPGDLHLSLRAWFVSHRSWVPWPIFRPDSIRYILDLVYTHRPNHDVFRQIQPRWKSHCSVPTKVGQHHLRLYWLLKQFLPAKASLVYARALQRSDGICLSCPLLANLLETAWGSL